ncbi:MAG: hypothetical protein Q4D36_01405, partial [Bacteroidales bacterium]|nr:hypothetical protein [Bacteroidales bacterium]
KEIEGATIQVKDKDGNIVDEWISTTESHLIKGLEEGQRKKSIEVARFLKSSGTSIELIAGATGLSKEEIEKL